jgi:eukaryotic translation initiation factor 2C
VVIVAQKNHHTKFFQPGSPDNVPAGKKSHKFCRFSYYGIGQASDPSLFSFFILAGTIIDNKVCHPRNNDFYLCAHAGMIVSINLLYFDF